MLNWGLQLDMQRHMGLEYLPHNVNNVHKHGQLLGIRMIFNNASELMPLEMNGSSSATLIFIILILKFSYQVGQLPHMLKHIVDQM